MNIRAIELANQCFITENNLTRNQIERFYQLAHQDGQRAMKERAAKEAEPHWRSAEAIRNLEIE